MNDAFQPVSGNELPRFAGPSTFMRLPHIAASDPRRAEVQLGLFGVPFDLGTTNRPGARHGPRQVRESSTLIRRAHRVHNLYPFARANCADLGDSPINPADLMDSLARIQGFAAGIQAQGIRPLAVGGDHLISLPLLRAAAATHGPLGLLHFDSHSDTWDQYFGGYRYTHGTPFRRAIEEGLLDPTRCIQMGIRGSLYDLADMEWAEAQGVRILHIEDVHEMGPESVIAEARRVVGDRPCYLSFDIDVIDPAYAPGTGTPEIGGITPYEAQRLLRGMMGADIVAADLVEVSPPFDQAGGTAMVAANLLFEILCLMVTRIPPWD